MRTPTATADTAYSPELVIEDAIRRGGGEPELCVDPVEVDGREGQIVGRCRTSEVRSVPESNAPPVAGPEEAVMPHASPPTGPGCVRTALPLPDLPLIVEDLLMQAKVLADSGEPTRAVRAILEDVAALREGRD